MLDGPDRLVYRLGMRPALALVLASGLAACGGDLPDLEARLSPAARAADWPELVPLGPILRDTETLLPRDSAAEGESLAARAADLRRRAAALRRLPLG